ncbi:LysM peptidoglycan-binding domain-containing protein [Paenibacillus marinisediminis]
MDSRLELREEEQSVYDESYGLRFDIYERVHLSDEHVGIDQLEEVELTPHIQVLPAGEQVTVRGSLLLAGAYIGTSEDRRSQTLEHWIPVEITLPLNRVRSLDEIRVDIENFDVDLLSTRSLNITGVLSLRGIYMEQPEQPAWESEQFTVIHEAHESSEPNELNVSATEPTWLRDYGQPDFAAQEETSEDANVQAAADADIALREEGEQAEGEEAADHTPTFMDTQQAGYTAAADGLVVTFNAQTDEERAPQAAFADDEPQEDAAHTESWLSSFDAAHQMQQSLTQIERQAQVFNAQVESEEISSQVEPQPPASTSWKWADSPWDTASSVNASESEPTRHQAGSESDEEAEREGANAVSAVEAVDIAAEDVLEREHVQSDPVPAAVEAAPEKSAMKVAIGSSKSEPVSEKGQLGFGSLLRTSSQADAVQQPVKEEKPEPVPARDTVSDDVNWQSIFLNHVGEERRFSKVRMCIVQRDDTLDQIATRYQMNPREIAMHNRLSEPSISEGQVLYIPISAV